MTIFEILISPPLQPSGQKYSSKQYNLSSYNLSSACEIPPKQNKDSLWLIYIWIIWYIHTAGASSRPLPPHQHTKGFSCLLSNLLRSSRFRERGESLGISQNLRKSQKSCIYLASMRIYVYLHFLALFLHTNWSHAILQPDLKAHDLFLRVLRVGRVW